MLETGELDLQLAFVGLRALREDLEDQLGAVERAHIELLLDVPLLRGRHLVAEDDVRGVDLGCGAGNLLDLAGAGVELRIGAAAPAADHAVANDAGTFNQTNHLGDAFLVIVVTEVEAHDDRRPGIGGANGGGYDLLAGQPTRRPSPLRG